MRLVFHSVSLVSMDKTNQDTKIKLFTYPVHIDLNGRASSLKNLFKCNLDLVTVNLVTILQKNIFQFSIFNLLFYQISDIKYVPVSIVSDASAASNGGKWELT
jgi:hypothetical protein